MNSLEDLWYGNIEPAEYDISPSKEYKELLQLISRNEDKLFATMTDTQKLFTAKVNNFAVDDIVVVDFIFRNFQFKDFSAKSFPDCYCRNKALSFCNIIIRPVFP